VALEPGVRAECPGRRAGDTKAQLCVMAETPEKELRGKRLRQTRGFGNTPTCRLDRPDNPGCRDQWTRRVAVGNGIEAPNDAQRGARRKDRERESHDRDHRQRGRKQRELPKCDATKDAWRHVMTEG